MLTQDNPALYHGNISEKSSQIYSRNPVSEQLSGYAKKYKSGLTRSAWQGGKMRKNIQEGYLFCKWRAGKRILLSVCAWGQNRYQRNRSFYAWECQSWNQQRQCAGRFFSGVVWEKQCEMPDQLCLRLRLLRRLSEASLLDLLNEADLNMYEDKVQSKQGRRN